MEEQQQRHSYYANFGRLLYESFLFYASTDSKVSVLYHGMSIELLFKNLQCKFCAPTSTTTQKTVATSFGSKGVVMKLESADSHSRYIKTIDMQLFTCYEHESEQFIYDAELRISDLFIPRISRWIGKNLMNCLLLLELLSKDVSVHNEQLLEEKNQKGLIRILECIANDTMEKFTQFKYVNALVQSLITQRDAIQFNTKNEDSLIPELTQLFVSDYCASGPFEIALKTKEVIICKLKKRPTDAEESQADSKKGRMEDESSQNLPEQQHCSYRQISQRDDEEGMDLDYSSEFEEKHDLHGEMKQSKMYYPHLPNLDRYQPQNISNIGIEILCPFFPSSFSFSALSLYVWAFSTESIRMFDDIILVYMIYCFEAVEDDQWPANNKRKILQVLAPKSITCWCKESRKGCLTMYSKLEEASYPLITDQRYTNVRFTKAGTYNPSNLRRGSRESFFLWKISDTILEIHELTSSKQLEHSCFIYNFANNVDENDSIHLQPQIEFIEHEDSGQHFISFYCLASNFKLYQFKVMHPVKSPFLFCIFFHPYQTHKFQFR